MTKNKVEQIVNEILEDLAAIEHDRWAHWQRYMHGKGVLQADGSMLISSGSGSAVGTSDQDALLEFEREGEGE